MLTVVSVALLVVLTVSAKKPRWHELEGYTFDQYRKDFKKPYTQDSEAYQMREMIFHENMKTIRRLNADTKSTWHAGVNMFTDMSTKEFKNYNRFRRMNGDAFALATKVHTVSEAKADTVALPKEVDWRKATAPRVLTAVKHQGSCGSCWAHSSVESIEAQYASLTGMLPVLSVAQINSCTPSTGNYGSAGCDGGDYVGSWLYLANKSVERPTVQKTVTENWAYPIPLRDWFFDSQVNYTTSACFDISTEWQTPATAWFAELTAAAVTGYGMINCNSADGDAAAMKALRDIGPMSISVAAGNWQWYESGVFNNTNSSGPDNEWGIDHAVQLVGYGYDRDLDTNYWIVRNSWSTLWGDEGFIRLWRAKDGQAEECSPAAFGPVCGTSGLLSYVAYPIVSEGTPTKFG